MRTFHVTRLTIDNQSQHSGFTAHSQKIKIIAKQR